MIEERNVFSQMKERAKNNRTITVTDKEAKGLIKHICKKVSKDGCSDVIICNDLMKVIGNIPDEVADLLIIDPPYNLAKDFGKVKFKATKDADKYEEYLRSWLPLVVRKLKPNGSMYVCGDWKCTSSLQRVIEETGMTILNRITWQREKGRGAKNNWKNSMEDIWFAVKNPDDYYFNLEAVKVRRRVLAPYRKDGEPKDWVEESDGKFRDTCPSNLWDDISVPFWSMPENTDHPTQKPEKLYAKLILASSKEGDLVLDPFMGSGTACVTAKKLKRHYCGIEINEEFCLWAAKRLQMADTDTNIQGYSDGIFWERNSGMSLRHS